MYLNIGGIMNSDSFTGCITPKNISIVADYLERCLDKKKFTMIVVKTGKRDKRYLEVCLEMHKTLMPNTNGSVIKTNKCNENESMVVINYGNGSFSQKSISTIYSPMVHIDSTGADFLTENKDEIIKIMFCVE